MTEAEWLTNDDPWQVIGLLDGKTSDRKLRLCGVECCWLCPTLSADAASRHHLEVIERHADGLATDEDLDAVADAVWDAASRYATIGPDSPEVDSPDWIRNQTQALAHEAVGFSALLTTDRVASYICQCLYRVTQFVDFESEVRPIVRDIFGNPFRPVTVDPQWLTSTVVALARGIYEERVFDRMPILADALQDAGCDNADVLVHCRGDGPHVRGCWVVDLLLGKG